MAVGIKVCECVCVSYLQHSAFCSLRIFMAVRYAENLTLFRSATRQGFETGRREVDRQKESRGRKSENKMQQKPAHWAT